MSLGSACSFNSGSPTHLFPRPRPYSPCCLLVPQPRRLSIYAGSLLHVQSRPPKPELESLKIFLCLFLPPESHTSWPKWRCCYFGSYFPVLIKPKRSSEGSEQWALLPCQRIHHCSMTAGHHQMRLQRLIVQTHAPDNYFWDLEHPYSLG